MIKTRIAVAGLLIASFGISTTASAQDWGPPPGPPPEWGPPPPPPPGPPPPHAWGPPPPPAPPPPRWGYENRGWGYGPAQYGYGYGYRHRPHCWTEYRHHGWERVRICR